LQICTDCIWQKFNLLLKKFITKRVANEQDADDILQDVFIKIHKNLEFLMDESKIDAWIFSIARNAINDYYRNNSNKREITELSAEFKYDDVQEEQTANTKMAQCLKTLVADLPEIYREAITLTAFQNMTQKELSVKLNISLSGAKSRVQRARKKLKQMLLDCCYLEIDNRGNIIDYAHKSSEHRHC